MASPIIDLALHPLLNGPLLYLLTKAPEEYRKPVVQFLQSKFSSPDAIGRIVTGLGVLLGLGIIRKINAKLNQVALSHWTWFPDKSKWHWDQEIAVVTGGSMGIGKGVTDALYTKGIRVAILDVADIPKEYQGNSRVLHIKCDVTSRNAVAEAAKTIRQKFGPPSIVVNNAGIHKLSTILEVSNEYVEKEVGVNLLSNWYTVKEFLPDMIKKNKGHIVSVASVASFIQTAGIMPYAATKAGVLAFQEGLSMELRHIYKTPGIQVTTVHPSWVETPLVASFEKDVAAKVEGQMTIQYLGDVIVKQIMSCRGAQLILPDRWYIKIATLLRSWPNWMQEATRDFMTSNVDTFAPALKKRYVAPN